VQGEDLSNRFDQRGGRKRLVKMARARPRKSRLGRRIIVGCNEDNGQRNPLLQFESGHFVHVDVHDDPKIRDRQRMPWLCSQLIRRLEPANGVSTNRRRLLQ
jgi:hypothetical protein